MGICWRGSTGTAACCARNHARTACWCGCCLPGTWRSGCRSSSWAPWRGSRERSGDAWTVEAAPGSGHLVTPSSGFEPPPYPYDRLDDLRRLAATHAGGVVDLSVGAPTDPPPRAVQRSLADVSDVHTYPPSIGQEQTREAASRWMRRRLGVEASPDDIAACVGTKEFVVSLPRYMRLRNPERDTVLYPEVAYPSYAMGATLAGCRSVPVQVDQRWRIDVAAISEQDAARALCLWVNTPGNPAGGLDDLAEVARWGRAHGVPVFSDECYVEFTWVGPGVGELGLPGGTIVRSGLDGVVALHSLSKRSNFAGGRFGFYVGDPEIVRYLREVRKHAGLMVPAPVQRAAVAALDDDAHVLEQRDRYRQRLSRLAEILVAMGIPASLPEGGFYLWVRAPDGDGWSLARRFAERAGALVSPGELYGTRGARYVRVAAVADMAALDLMAERLGPATGICR
ncbi:MAG: succinyldiaminopimelate aminotransferase [Acidobacteria bacterium]|nr:MAG: succinyldiaminopimelate aminotransferase [Acidobacteriota bacterium]